MAHLPKKNLKATVSEQKKEGKADPKGKLVEGLNYLVMENWAEGIFRVKMLDS